MNPIRMDAVVGTDGKVEVTVPLPEGTAVEVRLPTKQEQLERAAERIRANQIHRYIGMDEIIEEDKREREERYDRWFGDGGSGDDAPPKT